MNQFCQSKSKTGQPLKANESSQIQHLRMQRFNPLITKRESRNITISRWKLEKEIEERGELAVKLHYMIKVFQNPKLID
jgi:hypothetical protein